MPLSVKDGVAKLKITKVFDRGVKCTKAGFSTSGTKDYVSGEWVNDFCGYVTFVGKANKKVSSLYDKTQITTKDFKAKLFVKKDGTTAVDMTIFDFEIDELPAIANECPAGQSAEEFMSIPDLSDELPFV